MNLAKVLTKALERKRLNLEETLLLWETDEIEKLGFYANKVMEMFHKRPFTTFVIGRNINYTNICDTYCSFCAFYQPLKSKKGYILTLEEIFQKIEETVAVGGTEILMQGGTHPLLPFSYYKDLLKSIKKKFPKIHTHCFSPIEIMKMKEVSGLSIKQVLKELKDAGLDSIPGGGAEILDDRTRKRISPLKGSWEDWMYVMQSAHMIGLHTTATMVIGFGESNEERALHLLRLRKAQDETGGFLAFIVWPFQSTNTRLNVKKLKDEEYLKAVAVCRLVLDNIRNFQASWVTMGPKIGVLSLKYGCNDFGSTMIEENVVSKAAVTHKVNINLTLELIRKAGKIPVQRNTKYEVLRIFKDGEFVQKDFVMKN